jgi:hypothetical protein
MATRSQDPGDVQRSQTDQAVNAAAGYLHGLPAPDPGMSMAAHDLSHSPGLSSEGGHESSHTAGLSDPLSHDSTQHPGLSHEPSVGDNHTAGVDLTHEQGAAAAGAGVHDAASAGYHHS